MSWCSDEDAYQPLKDIVVVVVEVKVGGIAWLGTKTYSHGHKMFESNTKIFGKNKTEHTKKKMKILLFQDKIA